MIRKKALITTFHFCPNYGAMLQAYALQEYLRTLFLEVRVLDYRPRPLLNQYRYINTYSFASILMSLWSLPTFFRKKLAFKRFEKNLSLTSGRFYCKEEITFQPFEYFFLGSDQIWNPDITDGFDSVYFGDISKPSDSHTIAYAASIGKSVFTEKESTQFKQLIKGISKIAMREDDAQELVRIETGEETVVVVDPTLLVGGECFRKFIHNVNCSGYILVYTLGEESRVIDIANEVSKTKGFKVIQVSGLRKGFRKSKHKVIYDAGIEDFLSLIYHADFVVTDSFHGTSFSILFHKEFITIPHKTRGGRILSLLSKTNLLTRLSQKVSDSLLTNPIDWVDVDNRLERMRTESKEYIKSVIYD